jgi:aerotolerance regulator-like protein
MPGFANPLLLWGLAASAVPVVIHLLNRRRFRVQRWAAMEWLLAAAKKNQKRLKLENLLLLVLRTAAVLFLALAIARPSFSDTSLSIDRQASHLFLLVDDSASTGARLGTGTALDTAVGAANALLSEIGAEDPVTLVLTNDEAAGDSATGRRNGRARVVLRGTHDHAKVRQFLADLKPAAARADLVEALTKLEEAVPARGPIVPKVAILTDLQRASFDAGEAKAGTAPDAAVRGTLERLRDKGAEVVLTPFGRTVNNVAITALRAQDDRDIILGGPVVFEAEVRNFGDRPVTAEVRFLVDGKERGEVSQQVPLGPRPAGGGPPPAVTAQFTAKFSETGELGTHVLEARIAADALAIDDVRAFAFEVRKPIRVLAVDGDPHSEDTQQAETYLLQSALAIEKDGPIRVDPMSEVEFEGVRDLAPWDLVVMANVEHVARGADRRRLLETYVKNGGAILFTVGDHVVPEIWNDEGKGLLPARLLPARINKETPTTFDLSVNKHPILADITNPASSIFRAPQVWGRMGVETAEDDKAVRVVMTYTDLGAKSPALVERGLGKGRLLLLTTTVDEAWTKLPADYLYPPLLHEIVYYLTSHGNADKNLLTYQTYTRTLPSDHADAVEVTGPDGQPVVASAEAPPDAAHYLQCFETARTGAYRVTIALRAPDILAPAPPPVTDAFAVNLTPLESDLDRMRPEEVESRWPGLLKVASSFTSVASAMRPRGGEIHGPLIIASILCLLGEVFLVRRIAKTRAVSA